MPQKPRRSYKWWIVAGLLCAAVAGVGIRQYAQRNRPVKTAVAVRTAKARKATLDRTLRIAGVTTAERSAFLLVPQMVGSRTHGHGRSDFQQVLQKLATPGGFVRKGDVVAQFDTMNMVNRLDDYRDSTIQHAANLRSLNALLDVKRDGYRQTALRYKGARDKAELESKKNPVLSAINAEKNVMTLEQNRAAYKEIEAEARYVEISEKAAIRRSELDYQVSKMELSRAEKNIDKMTVQAPIDGILVVQTIHRHGAEDAQIREGDELYPGQAFVQIVDTRSMAVNATVNQVDAEEIRLGTRARVQFDAFPGLEVPAHVVGVGLMARSNGWRGAYVKDIPVRLKIDGMDPRIIPNFSVSADVVLESSSGALVIPRESVFTAPEGKPFVFVRGSDGWQRREVELGLQSNVISAVRAGLSEGEEVALEWPPSVAR